MNTVMIPSNEAASDAELEAALAAVESGLTALGDALGGTEAPAFEHQAEQLQRALATAVQRFSGVARRGLNVPPELRHRLALASGRVAAQRETLARATAALDRAIDVLLPGLGSGSGAGGSSVQLYSAAGSAERPAGSGNALQA